MKEWFKRYKAEYHRTKYLSTYGTGFGLTEEDNLKGIYSIMDKLDDMCPFFSKIDKLFGGKPNVKPLGEICMNKTTYFHGIDDFDYTGNEGDDSDGAASNDNWGNVTPLLQMVILFFKSLPMVIATWMN